MEQGKISGTILKRSIMSYLHASNPVGIDSAKVMRTQEKTAQEETVQEKSAQEKNTQEKTVCLAATAVGVGESLLSCRLAVIKACNNLWCSGGEVDGLEVAFLVPATAREIRIKELTQEILKGCALCHTKILGGHTEVTDAVNRIVVTVTAIGHELSMTALSNQLENRSEQTMHMLSEQPKVGDDLVLTQWLGLEAVSLYLQEPELRNQLIAKFTSDYLAEIEDYPMWLTIEESAKAALSCGTRVMHDVSDGGIFTALWEFSERYHVGFDIDLLALPMRQPCVEVLEALQKNIYKEKSSGSLLVCVADGAKYIETLEKIGIPACIVGQITEGRDKILRNGDEVRHLDKS